MNLLSTNMNPELRQENIASPNRCIYCGSDGGADGLGDEHVIPLSLGGRLIIPDGSCRKCEAITSFLDGYLARKMFYDLRLFAGIKGRKRKEKLPGALPMEVLEDGLIKKKEFQIANRPFFLAFPMWPPPGRLRLEMPDRRFPLGRTEVIFAQPEGAEHERPVARGSINTNAFARAIAKIGYCHAVAELGLNGFNSFEISKLILGDYPYLPYLVGGEGRPTGPPDDRVAMLMRVSRGSEKLILARVRLFANIGTPAYLVVVGSPI